jgi:hypothetical protein
LLATAGMAACGGGGGSKPLTEVDFCTQKASKECESVAIPCAASMNACQAKRVQVCSDFVAAIQASPVVRTFRPENIAACANKAAEVYKKTPITPSDRDALDVVCNQAFSGKIKAGDPCVSSDYECDTGLICDTNLHTCAMKKPVAANAFCGNPGETCPAGQYCASSAGARQCTVRGAAGDACGTDLPPCLETLYCSAMTMKCTTKITIPATTCTSNSDCGAAIPYCDPFYQNTCDRGFEPSRAAPECADFGGNP